LGTLGSIPTLSDLLRKALCLFDNTLRFHLHHRNMIDAGSLRLTASTMEQNDWIFTRNDVAEMMGYQRSNGADSEDMKAHLPFLSSASTGCPLPLVFESVVQLQFVCLSTRKSHRQ